MRGKLRERLEDAWEQRNIPAYAGKTVCVNSVTITFPEHPRVCGENSALRYSIRRSRGTSPRMRGKHGVAMEAVKNGRNIPAYAGKTATRIGIWHALKEHPRVCGENVSIGSQAEISRGTSPRMRGKLLGMIEHCFRGRNIPAYAGKTQWGWCRLGHSAEHPRVCGENRHGIRPIKESTGTSPRMRGKRWPRSWRRRAGRNIPAYAGKTIFGHYSSVKTKEHPRVCGENVGAPRSRPLRRGTSPRMRGKRFSGVSG